MFSQPVGLASRAISMKHSLVYLRPFSVVYVRATGDYASSIPQAWERLFNWLDKNGLNSPIGRGYGLARDNPAIVGGEHCRYDACIELDPFLETRALRDLAVQTLPGGSYLRQRQSGDYNQLNDAMANFHSKFVPPQDLQLDGKRPLVTIFLDDPRRLPPAELRADICAPVAASFAIRRNDGRKAA